MTQFLGHVNWYGKTARNKLTGRACLVIHRKNAVPPCRTPMRSPRTSRTARPEDPKPCPNGRGSGKPKHSSGRNSESSASNN
ncbi:hypothetical protein AALO_G00304140 [Alosa alosa]|uniref:Uncharacterized protein n=1 Tax=Alosa alosa TaxID=278164 RepID=A0AAV6FF36_9TELE|nr:hypothetical protein AALO_G00304140 [Alosa alosa]